MSITKFDAVHSLVGGQITQKVDGSFIYHDEQTPPTEEAIQAKLNELQNAEPIRVMREQRNLKLAETDWWCCSDQTPTQAQLNYRVALRNLPSTESPSFDDNGKLTNVNWPEKPE